MHDVRHDHGLPSRLRSELESLGRALETILEDTLRACEERNAEKARDLCAQVRGLDEQTSICRETCLEILARPGGGTPEKRWTGHAHTILCLLSEISREIAEIASRTVLLGPGPAPALARDLPRMGREASRMLSGSIRSVLRPDVVTARRIMVSDHSLDHQREAFLSKATDFMLAHPEAARPALPYVQISRHLERLGDHASHMAQEVVYHLEGPPG